MVLLSRGFLFVYLFLNMMEIRINNSNVDNKINFLFSIETLETLDIHLLLKMYGTVLEKSIVNDKISLFSEAKVPGSVKLYLK